MIELGRLCLKTAGREAGKICIVVEILDKNYVVIDGEVKRKKCNITHLEPLDKKIEIKSKAAHTEIVEKFKALNIETRERKPKPRKERQKRVRKKKRLEEEKKGKKVKSKKNADLDRKVQT